MKTSARSRSSDPDALRALLRETAARVLATDPLQRQPVLLELRGLLADHDDEQDEELLALDGGQDHETIFMLAWSDTHDLEMSLRAHGHVRALVHCIGLMDAEHEQGREPARARSSRAEACMAAACETFGEHVAGRLKVGLKTLLPLAEEFAAIGEKLRRGQAFRPSELRRYCMLKSADMPALYAVGLEESLPSFDPNVTHALHCYQALRDIADDLEDLEEDLAAGQPNLLLLCCSGDLPAGELLDGSGGAERIRSLAAPRAVPVLDQIEGCLRGTALP